MSTRSDERDPPPNGSFSDQLATLLAEHAGLYRSLMGHTHLRISAISADYRILLTNAVPHDRGHLPECGLVGGKCFVEFQQRDEMCPHCPGGQAVRTGLPAATETQIAGEDGVRRDVRIQAFPMFAPDGATTGFIEIVEDISERKQSARALREINERFRMMYETAPLGYQSLDADGCLCDVNPAWLKTLGYAREEVIGRPFADFLTPAGAAHLPECFKRLQADGEIHGVELEMVRKDAQRIAVEFDGCLRHGEDDATTQTLCVFRDVTERKRAAEALRASTAELAALADEQKFLLENMRDFVYRHDTAGVFYYLSPAVEHVTGYSVDDWKNHYTTYLTDNPINEQVIEFTERTLRTGVSNPPYLVELYHKNGGRIMLEVSERPYFVNGKTAGIVGVARDVSERERAAAEKSNLEAQLRQAQKMEAIGQLAGGIAHDFNNILTTILGNAEMALHGLANKIAPDAPVLRHLHEVERAADRAATLTRQLLAFGRRQAAQPEVLDLNTSINEVDPMLRRLLTEDIEFTTELAPNLANVCADAGQIAQVVMNLVVNARDAMPSGGKLLLETSNTRLDEAYCNAHAEVQPGDYVLLAVSDTGCGMDAETRERIFEPFFTTKEVGKGSGLGLSMIYGIVKQTGGHVAVYSELGHGACFRIYLPAVAESVPRVGAAGEDAKAPTGSETILVCEDDDAVRDLAVQVLCDAGYHVIPARDGSAALNVVRACADRIHLLVTDIIMPDMNGRGLADTMAASRPDLKVLYISGYTHEVIAHHGVVEEGIDFLQKPFTRDDLLRRVRAALDDV